MNENEDTPKKRFKGFFGKKKAEATEQKEFRGSVSQEFLQINESLKTVSDNIAGVAERLRALEDKQNEESVRLEAITEFVQDGARPFVDALTNLADGVEEFYRSAVEENSPLRERAGAMWDLAKAQLESAGIAVIDNKGEAFDIGRETASSTVDWSGLPDGRVAKTLRCGYVFRGDVIRRAEVLVSKAAD